MSESHTAETSPAQVPSRHSAHEIAATLDELRMRHVAVSLGTGLAIAFITVASWLTVECFADWLFELPWVARLAFFVAGMGTAGALAWRFGLQPFQRPLEDDAVALMVERALPQFRSRFIASVQLARSDESQASPALVKALIRQTTTLSAYMDFKTVIATGALARWLKIAAAAFIGAAALWMLGGNNSLPLLTRALLWNNPVPRKTLISDVTGSRAMAVGEDIIIAARAGGIVPPLGKLQVKAASGKLLEYHLEADPASRGRFARLLQNVPESFDYWIELDDAKTRTFRVTVKPRPVVTSVECQQIYPAYTKLPAQRRSVSDLRILAGSRLALQARVSRPVKTAVARILGPDREQPATESRMSVDGADAALFRGEIDVPAKDATGLTLHL
ncbi:MAG: hypothetical protein M3463_13155, partial [Verrucomicrobiota bacterium]|nr:hypothetical protein [Verrucomicrobiota bacterium]